MHKSVGVCVIFSVLCFGVLFFCSSGGNARPQQFASYEDALPPIGHTIFCRDYPRECAVTGPSVSFANQPFGALVLDLGVVNRRVNAGIAAGAISRNDIFNDRWQLFPAFGNCTDYAITKRHELLRLGWPSHALLLAEVRLTTGGHHLVLVANAGDNSFVLDNLRPDVLKLEDAVYYDWIRIQHPENPRLWVRTSRPGQLSLLRE